MSALRADLATYRKVGRIPFEPVRIDPAALVAAADEYGEDVDEFRLGRAILRYLEAAEP